MLCTNTITHVWGGACWRAPGQVVMEQLGGVCAMLLKAASSESEAETPASNKQTSRICSFNKAEHKSSHTSFTPLCFCTPTYVRYFFYTIKKLRWFSEAFTHKNTTVSYAKILKILCFTGYTIQYIIFTVLNYTVFFKIIKKLKAAVGTFNKKKSFWHTTVRI